MEKAQLQRTVEFYQIPSIRSVPALKMALAPTPKSLLPQLTQDAFQWLSQDNLGTQA